MITRGGKELTERRLGSKVITAVYRGANLIWEYITSCFGSGLWREMYHWKESSTWKE